MVSTRRQSRARTGIEEDPNRVIAVVTGANRQVYLLSPGGYGFGICQQLLTNLSLPSSVPMRASTPQQSALAPSLQHLLQSPKSAEPTKSSPPNTTLTIILACRSETKALEARDRLIFGHLEELAKRKKEGKVGEKPGWREGLRIEWEGLDLDSPGGKYGALAFCEKLGEKYPHITTLYLNAGMGAFAGLSYYKFIKQICLEGMLVALSQPNYNEEIQGATTEDGERGLVWATNVLAPYIMVKELIPLLRRSPVDLPFSPRVIYTSSGTAWYSKLAKHPLDDYMLLDYPSTYGASKYMGDLAMAALDKEYGEVESEGDAGSTRKGRGEENVREVRVLTVDPGCVATNFFAAGLGTIMWWVKIKMFFNWCLFYFARLIGSPYHPVYASEGALPMLYAALIPALYLLPPSPPAPAQKYKVISTRWGKTKVGYGEVDQWERAEEEGLGRGVVERYLIATLNGVHAGKQGNDIRELHAKLSQTINHPIQPPIYRPIPPSTSISNSIASTGMPPPAPASSWNTPPPNTGFFLSGSPLGGVNGEGGFHPTGGGMGTNGVNGGFGFGDNEEEVGGAEGAWPSVPLPNRAFAPQPAYPSDSQNQYPSNPYPTGEPLNHSNGPGAGGGGATDVGAGGQQGAMEEERPYHAAVLPVKASPKDTGGFTEDAFKPLLESSERDQWGGFRQDR
ncbi:hypothetical protein I350_02364 [Cryptococcus amylolentus CBS 6273]|uniref:3-keto sterol reductase n=1 Tax=Cryptococcus amylolentus CBS 6273 TaxID=1296118 RepID=A0A1E3KAW2_9TREE|nr:hypothetical protein I350_02364 [Cryptococcus amylolentus CBS 6273]